MQKVVIVGCGGAGKSTLARQLGERLNLPVVHLDALFWEPGWQMISKAEEQVKLDNILGRPAWIIDGNYGSSMAVRFAAADTLIFLDFPTRICLWRVIKRYLKYRGTSRPDMSEGCPEKLDLRFLGWILGYRSFTRPQVLKKIEAFAPDCTVHILRTPAAVSAFLAGLSTTKALTVYRGMHQLVT